MAWRSQNAPGPAPSKHILIVDDNAEIHTDFRRVLTESTPDSKAAAFSAGLFATTPAVPRGPSYELVFAHHGNAGIQAAREARSAGTRFALAFVDMRMPSGPDGVETTRGLWAIDPAIHVVICTAYSDFSWADVLARLGENTSRLHLLRKPFGAPQVQRIADVLCTKWHQETRREGERAI